MEKSLQILQHRNIAQNPYCCSCGQIESIDLIFRNCFAVKIWEFITKDSTWVTTAAPFNDWLEFNAKYDNVKFNLNTPWATVFGTTMWEIWKNRNE